MERHERAKEYLEKAQAVFEKTFGKFEDDASRKSAWNANSGSPDHEFR